MLSWKLVYLQMRASAHPSRFKFHETELPCQIDALRLFVLACNLTTAIGLPGRHRTQSVADSRNSSYARCHQCRTCTAASVVAHINQQGRILAT